jgi:hypothetical protein
MFRDMKKRLGLVLTLLGIPGTVPVLACTVCRSRQPAPLRDITHGAGPSGMGDYIIIVGAVVVVVAALVFSIWYLVRPGERNPDHIKNIVLRVSHDGGKG